MERIAEAVASVLVLREDPLQVRHRQVGPLAREFDGVAYSFDATFPFESTWQEAPYANHMPHDVEALALKIPAFHDLSVAAVRELASHLTLQVAQPGETIVQRGTTSDAVYFVASGRLDVLATDDRSVLATIGEGGHVGEAGVLRDRPRGNHVVASGSGSTLLLRMSADALRALVARFDILRVHFERHIARIEP